MHMSPPVNCTGGLKKWSEYDMLYYLGGLPIVVYFHCTVLIMNHVRNMKPTTLILGDFPLSLLQSCV